MAAAMPDALVADRHSPRQHYLDRLVGAETEGDVAAIDSREYYAAMKEH
jgi:hypothetical protein